jgi:hypothetical protein
VVAKVREILAVSKEAAQKLDEEKFNLRKLKDLKDKTKYQVGIRNRLEALGNITDYEDISSAWENIKEDIHKKGDITEFINYRGLSLLTTTYKFLSNILLLRLTQYAHKIIGVQQRGFRRNRSTIDHSFCIRQMQE